MVETQRNRKAFVSHAHVDKTRAEMFARALREQGVESWLDKWEIQPGDSLIQKIFEEGLRDCSVFLVLLSAASVQSRWVRDELDVAMIQKIEGSTRVIPIVIEPCEIPNSLRSLHWIDMREGIDDAAKRVADVVFGVRNVPPVTPGPSQLNFDVPGLSELAARVAVHIWRSSEDSSDEPDAYRGQQLASALSMSPEDINDAVEELESSGLVEVRHYLGTAPFNFGNVEPTYALGHALRHTPAVKYDPEEDVKIIANAIVSQKVADGALLVELTKLSFNRVNAAVEYLEDHGLVEVSKYLGSGPFAFSEVEATWATRRFVANNG